jgi:hypothetical protein
LPKNYTNIRLGSSAEESRRGSPEEISLNNNDDDNEDDSNIVALSRFPTTRVQINMHTQMACRNWSTTSSSPRAR